MALDINNFNYNLPSTHSKISYSEIALAPINLTKSAIKTAKAYFAQDEEGLIEGFGKVSATLDLLISGVSAIFRGILYLGMWLDRELIAGLPVFFKMILLPYAIVGLVLSFFEFVYEAYNLINGVTLRWSLKFSEKEEDLIQNQKAIKKEFFKVSASEKDRILEYLHGQHPGPENAPLREEIYHSLKRKILRNKFHNLERRVSAPAAQDIGRIINSHHTSDLRLLTQIVDVQTKKMLIAHSIGLFSILLSAACYALLLVSFPQVLYVSLALALTSIVFYLIYIVLEKGFVEPHGYTFSFRSCIPERLYKLFSYDTEGPLRSHPWSSKEIQLMDMHVRQSPNYHYKTANGDL